MFEVSLSLNLSRCLTHVPLRCSWNSGVCCWGSFHLFLWLLSPVCWMEFSFVTVQQSIRQCAGQQSRLSLFMSDYKSDSIISVLGSCCTGSAWNKVSFRRMCNMSCLCYFKIKLFVALFVSFFVTTMCSIANGETKFFIKSFVVLSKLLLQLFNWYFGFSRQ